MSRMTPRAQFVMGYIFLATAVVLVCVGVSFQAPNIILAGDDDPMTAPEGKIVIAVWYLEGARIFTAPAERIGEHFYEDLPMGKPAGMFTGFPDYWYPDPRRGRK